jgi:hypothetical protein
MRCSLTGILAFTLFGACMHPHWCDSTCENRESAVFSAVQAAAYAVSTEYPESLPGNVDAKAYLAAARAGLLSDSDLAALESVELEVWTRADCKGAIVVARCPKTKRVILSDDTATRPEVDLPNLLTVPDPPLPARPDPAPTCPRPPRS